MQRFALVDGNKFVAVEYLRQLLNDDHLIDLAAATLVLARDRGDTGREAFALGLASFVANACGELPEVGESNPNNGDLNCANGN